MFMYKCIITAQYYENYSAHNEDWDGVSEGWKHKGGAEFVIDMSSDDRMCIFEDDFVAVVSKLLAKRSNKFCHYEYVSHEFVDADMPNITAEFFEAVNQLA